jgi:hypothetical protein
VMASSLPGSLKTVELLTQWNSGIGSSRRQSGISCQMNLLEQLRPSLRESVQFVQVLCRSLTMFWYLPDRPENDTTSSFLSVVLIIVPHLMAIHAISGLTVVPWEVNRIDSLVGGQWSNEKWYQSTSGPKARSSMLWIYFAIDKSGHFFRGNGSFRGKRFPFHLWLEPPFWCLSRGKTTEPRTSIHLFSMLIGEVTSPVHNTLRICSRWKATYPRHATKQVVNST